MRSVIVLGEWLAQRIVRAAVDIHHSFPWVFSKFLGKDIPSELLDKWAEKNAFQLGDHLSNRWDQDENYLIYGYRVYIGKESKFKQFRIYTSPVRPDDLAIEQSSFLQGEGPIPNLWLVSGIYEPKSGLEKITPELSHYGFMIDTLLYFFKFSIHPQDSDFLSRIQNFILQNKTTLDKIRKIASFHPRKLGSDTAGIAFLISDNMVLKIFRDKVSYDKALQAIEKLHKDPSSAKTEAMIYDAGRLGEFNGSDLYFYIMEKMNPVSSLEEDQKREIKKVVRLIARSILSAVDVNQPPAEPAKTAAKISQEILKDHQSIVEKLTSQLNLNPNWFSLLTEEIMMKYLSGRGDLHIGNLGITNQGMLRYFDPTHLDWTSGLNTGYPSDAR